MTGFPDNPELLLRERAWLRALARHLVQPHEGADELAADTLTAAMLQPSPHSTGLRGWLAAILRKRLAGQRRAEFRRHTRESAVAPTPPLPDPSDSVVRFELHRDVGNAVLALNEPYRTTVLLHFWDGLSPTAIADRMRVPVETVRTRLKRGLAQLRQRLDRAHGGDRAAWLVPLLSSLTPVGAGTPTLLALAGALLMIMWSKLAVGGVALAALVWLLMFTPGAGNRGPLLPSSVTAPATAVTEDMTATPSPPAIAFAATTERTAVLLAPDPVWLVVRGTIVDDATDAPLRDARVCLTTWPDGRDGPEITTAVDGTFTLREDRQDERRDRHFTVRASDYATVSSNLAFDRKAEVPQSLDVGIIRLVHGTWFSGQVVDQDGRGVADADLLLPLLSMGWDGLGGPQNMLQRTACLGQSDATGRFRLSEPIAPGVNHQNLLFAVAEHGVGWCRFEASKQRREGMDMVIPLRPTGGVIVRVESSDARPLADATVWALPRFGPIGFHRRVWRKPVTGSERLLRQFSGRTETSGELHLSALSVGERDAMRATLLLDRAESSYDLMVDAPGYPLQALQPFVVKPGTTQHVTISMQAARQVPITVLVHNDVGAVLRDVNVVAGAAQGKTDANGQIKLMVDAAPEISVVASRQGHRAEHKSLKVSTDNQHLQVSLVLTRTMPFEGRVTDQTGVPAAGMNLFVGGKVVATCDVEGGFRIEHFPMGLQAVILALGSEHDAVDWTGEHAPKQVDATHGSVTFVMQRRLGAVDARIAIVAATTGEALEPSEVTLCMQPEGANFYISRKRTQTTSGIVTATGMPAGRWRLAARTVSGYRGWIDFEVAIGQLPLDLRLELPAPGTIMGVLRFVDVTPPAEVTLRVRSKSNAGSLGAQYSGPGLWQIDASSQTVQDNQYGWTGTLHLQPARNNAFQLESAAPNTELVFTVTGNGVTGEATLRIAPGQTRKVVVEVHAKPQ